jgi:hypothetical protein
MAAIEPPAIEKHRTGLQGSAHAPGDEGIALHLPVSSHRQHPASGRLDGLRRKARRPIGDEARLLLRGYAFHRLLGHGGSATGQGPELTRKPPSERPTEQTLLERYCGKRTRGQ